MPKGLQGFQKGHTIWLGKKLSEETKNKIGKANSISNKGKKSWNKGLIGYKSGKDHWNWKGGISKIDKSIRQIQKYKQWRSNIFERDEWTCKTCGKNGLYITAHHIKSFHNILVENNIKSINEAINCEKLWDLDNGVTLCEECHKLTDNYCGRIKKHVY